MSYLRLRLYKPEKMLSAYVPPLNLCLTCTGYLMDDFSIEDEEHSFWPTKASICFARATRAPDAHIAYQKGSDGSRSDSGALHLSLPLDENIESFICSHDFESNYLILGLHIEDKKFAILTMGEGEDTHNLWKISGAHQLPVKIEWISVDLDPRPEVEPQVVEFPKPLPWQQEAISSFNKTQIQQLQATHELQRQLGAIKFILLALVIGALIYGFLK